ncbi:MAG: GxxExxY protein [Chloroflexi bacterium]|nr:GxxExxY protein [Chloroflexota bacterium]
MDTDKTQKLAPPPPSSETRYPHQDLTREIIGGAYEVYRELGPGFLEKVYETALVHELSGRGLHAVPQAEIAVAYKGQTVGLFYADIFVDDKVICEIKSAESLSGAHEAQVINHHKATGVKVGLLLNFGPKRVEVKRLVF